jgi:hypothetical protein
MEKAGVNVDLYLIDLYLIELYLREKYMGLNVAQTIVYRWGVSHWGSWQMTRRGTRRGLGWSRWGLLGAIALVSVVSPVVSPLSFPGGLIAAAHQTQISDGVGGTHHIEPSDTPKAGEPSQAWFALTQAGGKAIGWSDCDCELRLLGSGGEVIAQPELRAIAVEGLTDVPAAELTFPQVGAYVLKLTGKPKDGETFAPFSLAFPVTVAAGAVTSPQTGVGIAPTEEPGESPVMDGAGTDGANRTGANGEKEEAIVSLPLWLPIAGVGLTTIGLWILWKRR